MQNDVVTGIGTSNIALIKYWGKRNEDINIPANSSLSITLDDTLQTKTSILFSDKLIRDSLIINGEEYNLKDTKNEVVDYTIRILQEMRRMAGTNSKALIVSHNNFPTAAGLASSASGSATLAFVAAHALDLNLSPKEISILSRKISGSSCRSLFGGFVAWHKGEKEDGSDSLAEQVVDEHYWPEVIDVIGIVSEKKKRVSTRAGHKHTIRTSELFKIRPEIAERRFGKMVEAIKKKDFETMAEITMRDSNSIHATMLDSYPPIFYMNDTSREIVYAITDLNESEGKPIAAYTFDAGPNAQIITLEKHRQKIVDLVAPIVGSDKVMVSKQGSGPKLLKGESLIDVVKMEPK